MLSRAALTLRRGTFGTPLQTGLFLKRLTSTEALPASDNGVMVMDLPDPPVIPKDGPERDLVNFPRPKRAMYGGKVRMGFLPDEWFQFFYKKTGVTGPYLFGIGFVTCMVSKEYFVIDHEFHNGVSMAILCYILIKKFGPNLADYLNKEMELEDKEMDDSKQAAMDVLATGIEEEKKAQQFALDQKIIFNAKRENVLLQLEAEYRRRAMQVYDAFKRRMDYQLRIQESKKYVEHRHMVNWIIDSVTKSITPQQEADALKKCIGDLKLIATTSR